jgi:hypothetical protein
MAQFMRASFSMANLKVMEFLNGTMVQYLRATLLMA